MKNKKSKIHEKILNFMKTIIFNNFIIIFNKVIKHSLKLYENDNFYDELTRYNTCIPKIEKVLIKMVVKYHGVKSTTFIYFQESL